jgi:hypothetical protein
MPYDSILLSTVIPITDYLLAATYSKGERRNTMARQICQNCGMPLSINEVKGTDRDGSLSEKYCTHCYQNGEFTWKDATAEQMQVYSMGILTKDKHWPAFLARMATNNISKLERWQKERQSA